LIKVNAVAVFLYDILILYPQDIPGPFDFQHIDNGRLKVKEMEVCLCNSHILEEYSNKQHVLKL